MYSESYSGGRVPEAIDAAGFDAVVIRGKSNVPLVLSIYPGGALFHEAPDLWGKETYETEDIVPERFGPAAGDFKKRGAVVIGPAGENLVRFAIIANDRWRCAGRTGVGTVMGAKKLKAVLFQGDRKRPVADGEALSAFARAIAEESKDHPGVKAYKAMGTPMMVKIVNQAGAFPTRYWQQGRYEKWEQIGADALHSRCDVQPRACLKCFMACGRLTTVREGRHAGLQIEGPEYETIYAFGGCASSTPSRRLPISTTSATVWAWTRSPGEISAPSPSRRSGGAGSPIPLITATWTPSRIFWERSPGGKGSARSSRRGSVSPRRSGVWRTWPST